MTGTALGEEGSGVKEPHCGSLPQTTVQLTPPFLLSSVTVAAMPHCSLTIMEVGGSKLGVNVTVIAGSVEFWLPQAVRRTIRAVVISPNAS